MNLQVRYLHVSDQYRGITKTESNFSSSSYKSHFRFCISAGEYCWPNNYNIATSVNVYLCPRKEKKYCAYTDFQEFYWCGDLCFMQCLFCVYSQGWIYIHDPIALGSSISCLCNMIRKHSELFAGQASLYLPLVKPKFDNQRG